MLTPPPHVNSSFSSSSCPPPLYILLLLLFFMTSFSPSEVTIRYLLQRTSPPREWRTGRGGGGGGGEETLKATGLPSQWWRAWTHTYTHTQWRRLMSTKKRKTFPTVWFIYLKQQQQHNNNTDSKCVGWKTNTCLYKMDRRHLLFSCLTLHHVIVFLSLDDGCTSCLFVCLFVCLLPVCVYLTEVGEAETSASDSKTFRLHPEGNIESSIIIDY